MGEYPPFAGGWINPVLSLTKPLNCEIALLKTGHMKRLTLVLLTLGFLQIARAQFEGVLYYDCTIKNKTLTTIYASKTKVYLEAKIYPMKEGAAVIDKGREQDPLIFDFVTNKTTRLYPRHKESVTGDLAPVTEDRT